MLVASILNTQYEYVINQHQTEFKHAFYNNLFLLGTYLFSVVHQKTF